MAGSKRSNSIGPSPGHYGETILNSNHICAVCLEPLDRATAVVTSCGHFFCHDCIIRAVGHRCLCPNCRQLVSYIQRLHEQAVRGAGPRETMGPYMNDYLDQRRARTQRDAGFAQQLANATNNAGGEEEGDETSEDSIPLIMLRPRGPQGPDMRPENREVIDLVSESEDEDEEEGGVALSQDPIVLVERSDDDEEEDEGGVAIPQTPIVLVEGSDDDEEEEVVAVPQYPNIVILESGLESDDDEEGGVALPQELIVLVERSDDDEEEDEGVAVPQYPNTVILESDLESDDDEEGGVPLHTRPPHFPNAGFRWDDDEEDEEEESESEYEASTGRIRRFARQGGRPPKRARRG
ncbi:hypothetical protein K402DRAFT_408411 [Aulographum hederae CBS 113979]|uniref:RING-type domain-containing protein n=1 Tax=Aulographum hederae CBS 113979 TaxID=1176131 RepID=A0A6G1GKY8_9PEZI|nr:hypothetical protein K402DRAFT_408411 [Aulographum hederae CBS 113979]